MELHELCGGAPDEVQLYCHHMYRSVEEGSFKRMALTPQVFREVLHEYRSNSSANVDAVLGAIERLPDKLLFESEWLSRKNLTLEENIRVTVLARELKDDKALSAAKRAEIAAELTEGYQTLFGAGITEIDNCIQLAGAPLSAGFWKSFVEVERGKRWTWDDHSFAATLRNFITIAIGRACRAIGTVNISQGQDAVLALQTLRDHKIPAEFDEGMSEMIVLALFAHDCKATCVADVSFQLDSPAGKQVFRCRYLEKAGQKLKPEQFQEWIEGHRDLLAGNEITFAMYDFTRWELPSPDELHRLGRISGYRIPDVFGPNQGRQAVATFGEGDVDGCMEIFARMLADKDDPQTRNNLAFCQILTGDVSTGLENATKALKSDYAPLFELNKGIAEFLQGYVEPGKQSLRNALQRLRESDTEDNDATYVLVVDPSGKKVEFTEDFTVDAAILINLWRMGDLTRDELEKELAKLHPEKAQSWLARFPAS